MYICIRKYLVASCLVNLRMLLYADNYANVLSNIRFVVFCIVGAFHFWVPWFLGLLGRQSASIISTMSAL